MLLSCALAFATLVGCNRGQPSEIQMLMKPAFEQKRILDPNIIQAREDLATGKRMEKGIYGDVPEFELHGVVPGSGREPSAFAPVGTLDANGRMRGADSDYIDKADVYWKLNWIRKQILTGNFPENFEQAIAKTRKLHETTRRDKNYDLAAEAIKLIEEGWEHHKALVKLRLARISLVMVPWAGGTYAVQRFIDEGGLGFGEKPKTPARGLTTRNGEEEEENYVPLYRRMRPQKSATMLGSQQEAIAIVLTYAQKYRNSPEEMMKRAWRRALAKIYEYRDELGLMNRSENNDGNPTEPGVGMPIAPRQGKMAPIESGTEGVVPIPPLYGAEPVAPTKEPDDPFATTSPSSSSGL